MLSRRIPFFPLRVTRPFSRRSRTGVAVLPQDSGSRGYLFPQESSPVCPYLIPVRLQSSSSIQSPSASADSVVPT